MVRFPMIDGVEENKEAPSQKADEAFISFYKNLKWTEMPLLADTKCEYCEGRGFFILPMADGAVDKEECGECLDGFLAAWTMVEKKKIANNYLRKMKLLPDLKISPSSNEIFEPMPFTFHQEIGQGLIMPCKYGDGYE